MSGIRVGIIGFGYWGPNLTRNYYEINASELVAIVDVKDAPLARAKAKYPNIIITKDYQELFNLGLDAVVISTPPKTHFNIAKDCLLHGLNVLIEKPMTDNSRDAAELIEIAEARNLVLMVGHTFQYNTAVQALKQYIQNKELGDIYYLDTARLNLGLYQRHTNVLWDLAPHDISILLYLLDTKPTSVSANAVSCVIPGVYDVAYVSIFFPDNITAYVHVSWLDPCKVRRVTVIGSKKMAVFNDIEEDKIKIYDKGVEKPRYTDGFGEFQYNYRSGIISIPKINYLEPLHEECMHFLDCIANHKEPSSSGKNGLDVIKIIEAAQRSIANNSSHEVIPW